MDARRPDGTAVPNAYGVPGRAVVVNEQPLLEVLNTYSNFLMFLQYALPNSTVALQWATNVPPDGGWKLLSQSTQTNLVQPAFIVSPSLPALLLRAVRQ